MGVSHVRVQGDPDAESDAEGSGVMLKKKKEYNPNEPVRWDVIMSHSKGGLIVVTHCYSRVAAEVEKFDLEKLHPKEKVEIREIM